MATDIHAITEVFDVADTALADAKAALADGTLNLADLTKFVNLWSPVKKALGDAKQFAGEATGMDGDDVQVVIARALKVVDEAVALVTG